MLYVSKFENNIVEISNTENSDIMKFDATDYDVDSRKVVDSIRSQLSLDSNEIIVGVVETDIASIYVPSISGIKALSLIDYDNCIPVIMNQKHNLCGVFKKRDTFNFISELAGYYSIGDIAIRTMGRVVATDSCYWMDGYLYILVDETENHFLYFKYKILDEKKLERLAVKKAVLER